MLRFCDTCKRITDERDMHTDDICSTCHITGAEEINYAGDRGMKKTGEDSWAGKSLKPRRESEKRFDEPQAVKFTPTRSHLNKLHPGADERRIITEDKQIESSGASTEPAGEGESGPYLPGLAPAQSE